MSNPAFRMLIDALDRARRQIRGRASDQQVHEARKSLKKARAALRLLRAGLGDACYQSENAALRDAGRILSPLRDARVLIDALETLKARHADALQGLGLSHLREDLHADLAAIRARLRRQNSAALRRCLAVIGVSRRRLMRSAGNCEVDEEALWQGLQKLYRKARRAEAAASSNDSTALHEWRKQVKYLLNATEPLLEAGKGRVFKMREQADRLADELGDDHDLAVLCERAQQQPAAEKPEAIEALQALVRQRRAKLQKRAIRLGEKLFDRKPRKFIAGISKRASFAARA